MRLHVLAIPHTITSKEHSVCAFTQNVLKFCDMMTNIGYEIIHYGHPKSEVVCTEHVSVISEDTYDEVYGDFDWKSKTWSSPNSWKVTQEFENNCIKEINDRKQPGDFLLAFYGSGHQKICDSVPDIRVVEPAIGYGNGYFAQYKVFASYAHYHAFGGNNEVLYSNNNWFNRVIPHYFDLRDFEYNSIKEDYFLFMSRICEVKGIHIAQQVTREAGVKLVVAGQNIDDVEFEDHVEFVGHSDVNQRRELMKNAKALIFPTMYHEPFGKVQVEALLSGTPAISTDWGACTEINIEGVTGFRCRNYQDFVRAIKNIDQIKPIDCRRKGEEYSMDKIALMYDKYFKDLCKLNTSKGWYHLDDNL